MPRISGWTWRICRGTLVGFGGFGKKLEEYCEGLYGIHAGTISKDQIGTVFSEVEHVLQSFIEREEPEIREVVFLVRDAEDWKSQTRRLIRIDGDEHIYDKCGHPTDPTVFDEIQTIPVEWGDVIRSKAGSPKVWQAYQRLTDMIRESNCIWDDSGDSRRILAIADGYYGDGCPLMTNCRENDFLVADASTRTFGDFVEELLKYEKSKSDGQAGKRIADDIMKIMGM